MMRRPLGSQRQLEGALESAGRGVMGFVELGAADAGESSLRRAGFFSNGGWL